MIVINRTKEDIAFTDTDTGVRIVMADRDQNPMAVIDFLSRCLVATALTVNTSKEVLLNYFVSVLETANIKEGEPLWTWEDIKKLLEGEDL